MFFSLTQWLIPPAEKSVGKKSDKHHLPLPSWAERARERLQWRHVRNNWQLFLFLALLAALNVVLFVARACEFRGMRNLCGDSQNYFYMLSRACGRTLLLQSVVVFAAVLRYTITKLRNLGASRILPLDNNIYIHKVVGVSIFVYSWVHGIMHICNFCKVSHSVLIWRSVQFSFFFSHKRGSRSIDIRGEERPVLACRRYCGP